MVLKFSKNNARDHVAKNMLDKNKVKEPTLLFSIPKSYSSQDNHRLQEEVQYSITSGSPL